MFMHVLHKINRTSVLVTVNQAAVLQSIVSSWENPGFSLIVCNPDQSVLFWYYFRKSCPYKMLSFPTNTGDFSQWSGELLQSFLGAAQVYWGILPLATSKTNKARQMVIQFLKGYHGPHAVWILASEEQAAEFGSCRKVIVASQTPMQELGSYATLLGFERSVKVLEACDLSRSKSFLSLDEAVLLLLHAGYVPMRLPEQSTAFLSRLLPQELSLVQLSELFFKRDWKAFLKLWNERSIAYGDMFWISFWAEQFWRAYWVCWYMKRGQQTRARSMGYRLPNSFMSSGWQQSSLIALRAQYERVAFFDTNVKKGSFLSAHELVTELVAITAG
ncbi:MAG: hypothetical protein QG632_349 [Candidatus Dependentiae bacterium]|nr:hypothetical protein [Candidatus Dependentiae bacterium]